MQVFLFSIVCTLDGYPGDERYCHRFQLSVLTTKTLDNFRIGYDRALARLGHGIEHFQRLVYFPVLQVTAQGSQRYHM